MPVSMMYNTFLFGKKILVMYYEEGSFDRLNQGLTGVSLPYS